MSHILSSRQPIAPGRLFEFRDYKSARGQRALSVTLPIRDMARFYAPDKSVRAYFKYDWSARGKTQYVPRQIHSADDALDAIEQTVFPIELRHEALRASRYLTDVFQDVTALRRVYDQTSGRLDRRKLKDIARTTAAGTYNPYTVRPYRRYEHVKVERPTVAVVGSGAWGQLWDNKDYIPRVLTVSLAVAWACEAANLKVVAALTQGPLALSDRQPYRDATLGWLLVDNRTTPLSAYTVALHSDLFRYGSMMAKAADRPALERMYALQSSEKPRQDAVGGTFPSRDGGCAVQWAREVYHADVVIAIDSILDAKDADATITSKQPLQEAIREIARQVKQLR